MHSVACVGDSQFFLNLFSSDLKLMLLTLPRMSWLDIYLNLLIFTICSFQGTLLTPSGISGEYESRTRDLLLTGLAVISCCSSVPVSMPKDFVRSFRTLVDWYFRILGEVFSNLSFLKFPSDLVFFFLNLAATYSPTPSPVQYHRPFRSLPSCSGWERVLPLNASPPKAIGLSEVFSSLVLSLFSALGEVLSNLVRRTSLYLITQQ